MFLETLAKAIVLARSATKIKKSKNMSSVTDYVNFLAPKLRAISTLNIAIETATATPFVNRHEDYHSVTSEFLSSYINHTFAETYPNELITNILADISADTNPIDHLILEPDRYVFSKLRQHISVMNLKFPEQNHREPRIPEDEDYDSGTDCEDNDEELVTPPRRSTMTSAMYRLFRNPRFYSLTHEEYQKNPPRFGKITIAMLPRHKSPTTKYNTLNKYYQSQQVAVKLHDALRANINELTDDLALLNHHMDKHYSKFEIRQKIVDELKNFEASYGTRSFSLEIDGMEEGKSGNTVITEYKATKDSKAAAENILKYVIRKYINTYYFVYLAKQYPLQAMKSSKHNHSKDHIPHEHLERHHRALQHCIGIKLKLSCGNDELEAVLDKIIQTLNRISSGLKHPTHHFKINGSCKYSTFEVSERTVSMMTASPKSRR